MPGLDLSLIPATDLTMLRRSLKCSTTLSIMTRKEMESRLEQIDRYLKGSLPADYRHDLVQERICIEQTLYEPDHMYYTRDVTEAKNGDVAYVGYWWLCREGDPKQAIFYHTGAPQCNQTREIVDGEIGLGRIQADAYPDAQVVFIPTAFVPRR